MQISHSLLFKSDLNMLYGMSSIQKVVALLEPTSSRVFSPKTDHLLVQFGPVGKTSLERL
jgi:hypothetical protein